MTHYSRRSALAFAGLATAIPVLAACSSKKADSNASSSAKVKPTSSVPTGMPDGKGSGYLGVTSVGHRRYDVIVSDCFGGAEPVRELATVEALRLVRGSLNAGGIYVANIVSANEGGDVTFLRDCAATALEVFIHAWVVPCGDAKFGGEENYLLIASDGDYAFAEAVPFDTDFLGTVLHDK